MLITDFLSAKITDFGTSRAKATATSTNNNNESVLMTSVGTPLFCAPELMRGEVYDEKVV